MLICCLCHRKLPREIKKDGRHFYETCWMCLEKYNKEAKEDIKNLIIKRRSEADKLVQQVCSNCHPIKSLHSFINKKGLDISSVVYHVDQLTMLEELELEEIKLDPHNA